ncbi:uncharacterized protein VDAG_06255 [Verticillium dahliae VdLs.17]|uniref:Uncharacterized protein n=1 Tax=Verticillium dahliae (strain VdLs.17 / ATCC MYA-4575 / FGSC 10137) TaxID=498257 RepID=G2X7Y8_VERDV|nr:uncharacterized protein VDAG_06255 [Verticillium dahliae VdLs.17]EGY15401.1 hypothetical protein VDAG_06255 [Verticillium dahliae VdLs.17]
MCPGVTSMSITNTSDFGQLSGDTITIRVPDAAVKPAAVAVASAPLHQAQAPLVSPADPQTGTAPTQDAKKAIARPTSIGEGWYINTDRWLAKTDGENPTNKATTSVAYCFCSEGDVCCNSSHGVQCDYGICGI